MIFKISYSTCEPNWCAEKMIQKQPTLIELYERYEKLVIERQRMEEELANLLSEIRQLKDNQLASVKR
jgi:hypothetical protein